MTCHSRACGPFFPSMMLVGGDSPVFTAPVARFYDELTRISTRLKIPHPPYPVVESTNGAMEATLEADLADLRLALRQRGDSINDVETAVIAYAEERQKLLQFLSAREAWCAQQNNIWNRDTNSTAPAFPSMSVPVGLPREFAIYFEGAIAWHANDYDAAESAWLRLLGLPVEERRFKSTWAAFMLAKSYEDEDPAKAVTYYGMVRALANEHCRDTLRLAGDSIGWEGRAHLKNGRFDYAIDRYLEQLAAGDGSAYQSLRVTARRALQASDPTLDALAKNIRARSVITAHIISTEWTSWGTGEMTNRVGRWLAAVERANVTDLDSAERLALANYQVGNFDLAQRWVKRATNSLLAQWIDAKLLLRKGKVNEAAVRLAKLSRRFPLVEPTNNPHATITDSLYVPDSDDERAGQTSLGCYVLGELGVLRLHRREYAQALDALLNAGFHADASYVAERVMKVDELKRYVDDNWPEIAKDTEVEVQMPEALRPSTISKHIRHVLARRMMRSDRVVEARRYFPEEWHASYNQLMIWLVSAEDTAASNAERGSNYYRAAWMVRTNGMELMGTEVEPDFTVWAAAFKWGQPSWSEPRWQKSPRPARRMTNCAAPARIKSIPIIGSIIADTRRRWPIKPP